MSEQCLCYHNDNICIMYIESTIHPYHSIAKSKVQQNQPFLKPICYYIRIEEREEKKGKKRGENGHNIVLYFLRANPKSRLFQNVKKVPTSGIPNICRTTIFRIPEIWTIFTSMPIYGIPKIWEFHLYQYLAIRVKCQIVPRYLEIQNFCHSVCFSSPTL